MKVKRYYVAWSSWFITHPYDIEKIKEALKSIGCTNIMTSNCFGWRNQPKVVTFNYEGDGTDYAPTKAVETALKTEWIIVRLKNW